MQSYAVLQQIMPSYLTLFYRGVDSIVWLQRGATLTRIHGVGKIIETPVSIIQYSSTAPQTAAFKMTTAK